MKVYHKYFFSKIAVVSLIFLIPLITSCTDCSRTSNKPSNQNQTAEQNINSPLVNASFDKIYPKPFIETKTGRAVIITTFVVVTSIYLYFAMQTAGSGGGILSTAPMTAKFIATQIGMLLNVGSGATMAGFAAAGFGSLKGGILVIASLISLGSGVIVDVAVDQSIAAIKKEPYKRYEYLKLPLIEAGSDDVVKLVEKIREVEEEFIEGKISVSNYKYMIEKDYSPKLKDRLENIPTAITTKDEAYDLVNRSIYYFNTGKYDLSERDFNRALSLSKDNSFILYGIALNNLVNNKYNDAIIKLSQCNIQEPKALQPYILHIMALKDNDRYQDALLLAESGIKNIGKKYALAWEAGELNFYQKNYKGAAKYFEIAYDEVDEDIIEAEAARMVALSYKKMGHNEEASKWYKKALKKVGKNIDEKKKIEEMWENE